MPRGENKGNFSKHCSYNKRIKEKKERKKTFVRKEEEEEKYKRGDKECVNK